MLLIHIGKLILPQTLDELVRFLYVVPFTFTLHEHAYGDVFGYKNNHVCGILRL